MAFLTEKDRQYKTPEDILAHVGDEYDKFLGAIVPPIFQNSLFVQGNEMNGVDSEGYHYSRVGNPTTSIVERKVAALEGADGALCFASGMAAISSAIMYFIRANCHIILVGTAYGCTTSFVENYLAPKFNIEFTYVNGDTAEIEAAIRPNTALIFLESPSSAVFRMQDLAAVAAIAKKHGVGTAIDGTYATPLHQQPLKHGIDIVCHTASKYLGGHSDIVAGILAARREIIESIQGRELALLGGCMDPHQAWLMLRGMRTMMVRLKQHGENALRVAQFLENHPKVKKVFYPGSDTYEQKELFNKYLTGLNGLMSFVPNGTQEEVLSFIHSLHYFQNGCSWGGFESLCVYLGSNEHMRAFGQPDNLVRIHVGLENADTLIADLDQALSQLPD